MAGFLATTKNVVRKLVSGQYQILLKKRQKVAAQYAHGSILDIGCAQAFNPFLEGDVSGLDVIKPFVIPDNYKRFIQADFRSITSDNNKERFDTLIALEVLEHIPDYVSFLRTCYNIMKENGILILSVPNPLFITTLLSNIVRPKGQSGAAEMDGRILNEPYYGHINFLFPRLLNRVLHEIGFRQVEVKGLGNYIDTTLTAIIFLYIYRKG